MYIKPQFQREREREREQGRRAQGKKSSKKRIRRQYAPWHMSGGRPKSVR
jgi:hypothetical protein